MRDTRLATIFVASALALAALTPIASPVAAQSADMNFFITSEGPGDGANLGGLEAPTPIARRSRTPKARAVSGGRLT